MYVPFVVIVTTQLSLPVAATNPSHTANKPRRDDSATIPLAPRSMPTRGALSPTEAAQWLGISRSTFYASVLPDLKVATLGRRVLVPIAELERWLTQHSATPTR